MNRFYESERLFKLWGYTVSHSFLLMRSPMLFEDVEGYRKSNSYNIDIEFVSVVYLNVPNSLVGVKIREIKGNIPIQFEPYKDSKVFEIG